jgi:hypothetical protein
MDESSEEEEEDYGKMVRAKPTTRKLKKGDKIRVLTQNKTTGNYLFVDGTYEGKIGKQGIFTRIKGHRNIDGVYRSGIESMTWKFPRDKGYRGKEPSVYVRNRFVDWDNEMP